MGRCLLLFPLPCSGCAFVAGSLAPAQSRCFVSDISEQMCAQSSLQGLLGGPQNPSQHSLIFRLWAACMCSFAQRLHVPHQRASPTCLPSVRLFLFLGGTVPNGALCPRAWTAWQAPGQSPGQSQASAHHREGGLAPRAGRKMGPEAKMVGWAQHSRTSSPLLPCQCPRPGGQSHAPGTLSCQEWGDSPALQTLMR